MKPPRAPRLDERRAAQFASELMERARAWIPSWGLADGEGDFGRALLEVAARFDSEVAERLDRAGEKMGAGFLDWLAVRGEAARPSRMPVVLKLADAAREAVTAPALTRMQVGAAGANVVFETETEVRLVPGRLEAVVGVDADADAFYLPPPGMSDLQPLEPLPTEWRLKSFAAGGAKTLQLDPESGLTAEMILEAAGRQYRIVQVDKEIVSIEPALAEELSAGTRVRKVTSFAPFDGAARNRQEHALYLGHAEVLNVEAAATLEVVGAQALGASVAWQYWGKVAPGEEVGWQPLTLADEQKPDAVVLKKPGGALEPREVGEGNSSRWIRAFAEKADSGTPLPQIDALALRVNCGKASPPCPAGAPSREASPEAEGMANTTPLVLESVFFPLGREPRQFDAFYLGSEEAFSKKAAEVRLCFEMADLTCSALSAVRTGDFAKTVLAGVGNDGSLHLLAVDPTGAISKFHEREPLQPPLPGFGGQAAPGNTVALDKKPPWRLPVWSDPAEVQGFLVAASTGDAIWAWAEGGAAGDRTTSGWIPFGSIPAAVPPATKPVAGLVYLGKPAPALFALRDGQLAVGEPRKNSPWHVVRTRRGSSPVRLESIVPVLVPDAVTGQLTTSSAKDMVGVSDETDGNRLYRVDTDGTCTEISGARFDTGVRPVAVRTGGELVVALVKQSDLPVLVTVRSAPPDVNDLEHGACVLGLDAAITAAGLHFFASVQVPGAAYLASWTLPAAGAHAQLFSARIPSGVGVPGGAPTEIAGHVVIPGTRGDALVAEFDFARRFRGSAEIKPGVVMPASAPALVADDVVARMVGGKLRRRKVKVPSYERDGEVIYPIHKPFPHGASGPLIAYQVHAQLTGSRKSANELILRSGDHEAMEGSWLLVDGNPHHIDSLDRTDPWTATLSPDLGAALEPKYSKPLTTGRTAPYMDLAPANGNWDAALLRRASLAFPGLTPERQSAKAFDVDVATNHSKVVALAEDFDPAPAAGVHTFIVDAAAGEWSAVLGDTSTNPELSWEYWNGKGWWKLDVEADETLNLKKTGAVRFDVPADIASSDWAGKTNHWIRARLVGGDYGREKVTVTTSPTSTQGVTQQTVERSSEGIRAPAVVTLGISYRLCAGVQPTFVLAQDSGSLRDQSDANRTAGAIVEAFVPLAVALGRLAGGVAAPATPDACTPECSCPQEPATAAVVPAPAATPSTGTSSLAAGRALLIGLDATLSDGPINVLLLVEEERDHGAFAPMAIEALVADRFVPIVASDATRAVGESGLLSMTFAVKPTRRDLFGKSLTWLRLTPAAGAPVADWKPIPRGAYLNAAWASAAETLTRELLGSSEGAPNLTLHLARPPVLRDTLELRVKEPLGDEEREALREGDASRVMSDVDGLPGDWVLWRRVIDPADEPAAARVYALDESNGEVRFGDGLHGAIPPIGRDSIVAFSYRRTEAGPAGSDTVPANAIAARTALGLVSPVESVEAVLAADQAAGGAPPESVARVLRFGAARLRHRDRAVTARDLEDLALQSSPDIVQARCLVRPRRVRLVVVMRGGDPRPSAAQVRELRRQLLAAAPPSLGAPEALRIEGPVVRRLRVDLRLAVADLDQAGLLGRVARERLVALLDTGTGGADEDGWALGDAPSEGDVALALVDTPHLESIEGVTLREIASDGAERPWPEALKPNELAMLAEDGVRIQYETVEVVA